MAATTIALVATVVALAWVLIATGNATSDVRRGVAVLDAARTTGAALEADVHAVETYAGRGLPRDRDRARAAALELADRTRSLATAAPATAGALADLARAYVARDRALLAVTADTDAAATHRTLALQSATAAKIGDRLQTAEAAASARITAAAARVDDARTALVTLVLAGAALAAVLVSLVRRRARHRRGADRGELVAAHVALLDPLTGLGNVRAFHDTLERTVDEHPARPVVCLVRLDIDGMRAANDRDGHRAGDDRLLAVAAAIRACAGAIDAFRTGGDEFALVLPDTPDWTGFRIVQRIQEHLAAGGETTVSAGIATSGATVGRDALAHRSSIALLVARRSPGRALIYAPDLDAVARPVAREARRDRVHAVATALAHAVDAKDAYTRSHCQTVSALAALIAASLGLDGERIEKVRLAGLLHDVGKIGIADSILQKPSRLTDEEFEIMKTHATLGERIVDGAGLHEVAGWVRHHHERPDGKGYPDGLFGSAIPLESRIILVADAFEAMTSDRPYRDGGADHAAIAELERHAGTQFDPDCVAALVRHLREEPVADAA
jgi:diguanylate cyclase (GGDEF)-like protein/putative nucleotidyltransferase with HDIG domain